MASQNVVIGIAVGMFLVGLTFGYVAFVGSTHSGNMMMNNQQTMLEDPQFRQVMMESITQDPETMRAWMQNTQHAEDMGAMMRENHDFAMQMMYTIIEDPAIRLQMLGHMTENQEAMQQMMNMMGSDIMMDGNMMTDGTMMTGNHMIGSGMMNQDMMSSQSSQPIPANTDPQTRTFQISMEEVEFFAESENEEGDEGISFVELHRWEPNLIIVNQGDTVVLEITNPRKHAHTFSVPEFGINSQILEPREGMDTITFAADTSGVFTFYCGLPYNPDQLYCDPDHSMMTGTLVVLDRNQ